MVKLGSAVERIVATEGVAARNFGGLEAISAVAASQGVKDPVVFWVVVRDGSLCGECRRLHLQDDGVTPRLWRLSEIGRAYHQRGDNRPSLLGLHPHCRCTMTFLSPGFGFDVMGMVRFIKPDFDAYQAQRGE